MEVAVKKTLETPIDEHIERNMKYEEEDILADELY